MSTARQRASLYSTNVRPLGDGQFGLASCLNDFTAHLIYRPRGISPRNWVVIGKFHEADTKGIQEAMTAHLVAVRLTA